MGPAWCSTWQVTRQGGPREDDDDDAGRGWGFFQSLRPVFTLQTRKAPERIRAALAVIATVQHAPLRRGKAGFNMKRWEYKNGHCPDCGQGRFVRAAGSSGPWACLQCWPRAHRAGSTAAARSGAGSYDAPYQTRGVGGAARPRAGSGLRVVVSLSPDQLARIRPAGRALTSAEAAAVTRALAGEIADAFCRQVGRAAVMNRARARAVASQRERAERKARAAGLPRVDASTVALFQAALEGRA